MHTTIFVRRTTCPRYVPGLGGSRRPACVPLGSRLVGYATAVAICFAASPSPGQDADETDLDRLRRACDQGAEYEGVRVGGEPAERLILRFYLPVNRDTVYAESRKLGTPLPFLPLEGRIARDPAGPGSHVVRLGRPGSRDRDNLLRLREDGSLTFVDEEGTVYELTSRRGTRDDVAGEAEGWLTVPERGFFSAFGVDATVGGMKIRRDLDFSPLRGIARDADQPLRGHVEAFIDAYESSRVTREDMAQLARLHEEAVQALRSRMGIAVLGMLLGVDPWDATIQVTDGMMREGHFTRAWDLQASWIERGLNGLAAAESVLDAITRGLGERAEGRGSAPDVDLSLGFVDRKFSVSGSVGKSTLREPVVQVVLHRKAPQGELVAMNVVSALVLRALGIEAMDFEAAYRGGRLAGLQERALSQPLSFVRLLPTLGPGEAFTLHLPLPPAEAAIVERVEVRIWGPEGIYIAESVPGLDRARQEAAILAERDRNLRLVAHRQRIARYYKKMRNEYWQRMLSQWQRRQLSRAQMDYNADQYILREQHRRLLDAQNYSLSNLLR